METVLDIHKILELLPHRYPFMLVDRVLEVKRGEKVVGLKNVTYNEHFFQGHFPGAPVMPGVLIVEAMAQTGGILGYLSCPERAPGSLIYFSAIDKVRFRRPVVPGDQLILELVLLGNRHGALKMRAQAFVEEQLAAEAEMMAVWGE